MCKHLFENIGSALIPGYAEKKAADAQVTATEYGINKQNEIYDYNKAQIAPWLQAGQNAFNQYNMAAGLAPSDQPYGGFQQSPGYQFAFDEGMRGVNNAFAARGMLNSGARMKALTQYGQGLANQEYQNYLNNAFRSAGLGFDALGLNTQTASDYASNYANLWQNKGAAQASRYGGIANAWADARNLGINYLLGGGGGGNVASYDPSSGNWTPGPGGFPGGNTNGFLPGEWNLPTGGGFPVGGL